MSECIHCGARFVVPGKRKGDKAFKLTRAAHLDHALKAENSARAKGRKPSEELSAHIDRLSVP